MFGRSIGLAMLLAVAAGCSRSDPKPKAPSPEQPAPTVAAAGWSDPTLAKHYERLDAGQRRLIDNATNQATREAYVLGWTLLNANAPDTTLSDPLFTSIVATQPQGPKVRDTEAGYFDAGRVSFTLAVLAQAWAKGTIPPDHRGLLAAEAARLSRDSDELIQLQCASVLWALQNFPEHSTLGDAETKAFDRLIANEMLKKNLEAQQDILRREHASATRRGG